MKILTRVFLAILLSISYLSVNAQTAQLKAGLNLSNMIISDENTTYSDDFSSLTGFHVGFSISEPIGKEPGMFFETGLLITTRGYEEEPDINSSDINLTEKVSLVYLDIPLTIKGTSTSENGTGVYGYFGPYIGLAIAAKTSLTGEARGESVDEEEDLDLGDDPDQDSFKRLDGGLTFGAGLEFKTFTIGLSYDFGILNISPYQENGSRISNSVLKFSVGLKLGQ